MNVCYHSIVSLLIIKLIKINLFRMNQSLPQINEKRVLQVTNITHNANETDLVDLFSVAGDVARASIMQSGFPYYGFVEYFRGEDAQRGMMFNGKFFGPSKIVVDYSSQPFPQQPLLGNFPQQNVDSRMIRTTKTPQERTSLNRVINTNQPTQDNLMPMGLSNPNENRQTVQLNKPGNEFHHGASFDLFLSNIPVNLKEHNLHQIFSEFGSVLDVNIILDSSNLSTGRGKVVFPSYENALSASNAMNGKQLGGTNLRLGCQIKDPNEGLAVHQGSGPIRDLRQNLSSNNIRHHPYSITPQQQPQYNAQPFQGVPHGQQVHQHFDDKNISRPYTALSGPNTGIGGPNTGMGGPNTGMGGLNMGQRSSFNVHGGATHQLTASPNAPIQQKQPAAIYVGNLPETSCKSCLLYQLFAPYGAISSVKPMEPNGEPRDGQKKNWFGFVNFKDLENANIAILTLDKSSLDGHVLKVVMKTEKQNARKNFISK